MSSTSDAREFPRQYVAAEADFGQWEVAEPYFKELAERPITTLAELEKWLIDTSEVLACIGEEGTRREVELTRQTDDPERQQRHLHFIENIAPQLEPWLHKLNQHFVACSEKIELPPKRYEVLDRKIRTALELFRDENIPLNTEDERLIMGYQQITGVMSCEYDGREQTLQQMAMYLEEPDRAVREQVWRLITGRYLQDQEPLDELYVKMVNLRHQIARNAGFDNYRDFMFKVRERFDYTPDDCLRFHDAIEAVVLPAVKQLHTQRCAKLGIEKLRPWDTEVDPDHLPPLRPFKTGDELSAGCSKIFHQVNPELGRIFDVLREKDCLDLDSRKGKAPGGYQTTYSELRMPFIFMNAAGTETDVRTLLHEGGHAFHTWACRHEPFIFYRSAPLEFCEVASMGMECLTTGFTNDFFGPDTDRATRRFFEKIVTIFPYIASIDAFQHYVYTHVDAGVEAWKDEWQKISARFMPDIDYTGLEREDRHSWQRKLHVYQVPFYYIEYAIAQLGALQVWTNAIKDYEGAVAQYRNGLALGGSRPLPELFEAAGCRFDFTEPTLRPLIEAVMQRVVG